MLREGCFALPSSELLDKTSTGMKQNCLSHSLPARLGWRPSWISWEVWQQACAPDMQQKLTKFSCCSLSLAKKQGSSCFSSGLSICYCKAKEAELLTAMQWDPFPHLHQERRKSTSGTDKVPASVFYTGDTHQQRGSPALLIPFPHGDLRFDLFINSSY